MTDDLDLQVLRRATQEDAALRRVRRLQPVGGRGDKIFPPTYPGEGSNSPPRHVFERRRRQDGEVWCVLIDSVQSQANRLEEALLAAADEGGSDGPISLAFVTVDFRGVGLEPLERITSLDAPHRVYDAILRDSLLGGMPFMKSPEGRSLAAARPANATALLELSPSALLFGAWHSQGEGGGLGAKFSRALVSEIMGIDTPVDVLEDRRGELNPRTAGRRTGSRIDPLGISRNVKIFQSDEDERAWTPWTDRAARSKSEPVPFKRGGGGRAGKPSVINHGNIRPEVRHLGVTCDYAEHLATITLAGLRRLGFGGAERDTAGRTLIASLGLLALAEQDARGYALRSRCDLVCDGDAPLELVHADGSTSVFELDQAGARTLYREAHEGAKEAGFRFRSLNLEPQKKLVEIVRRSRELALVGEGGESDG